MELAGCFMSHNQSLRQGILVFFLFPLILLRFSILYVLASWSSLLSYDFMQSLSLLASLQFDILKVPVRDVSENTTKGA